MSDDHLENAGASYGISPHDGRVLVYLNLVVSDVAIRWFEVWMFESRHGGVLSPPARHIRAALAASDGVN